MKQDGNLFIFNAISVCDYQAKLPMHEAPCFAICLIFMLQTFLKPANHIQFFFSPEWSFCDILPLSHF